MIYRLTLPEVAKEAEDLPDSWVCVAHLYRAFQLPPSRGGLHLAAKQIKPAMDLCTFFEPVCEDQPNGSFKLVTDKAIVLQIARDSLDLLRQAFDLYLPLMGLAAASDAEKVKKLLTSGFEEFTPSVTED